MSFPRALSHISQSRLKVESEFAGGLGAPGTCRGGTLHDTSIGCVWTRLGGKAVELVTSERSKNEWPSGS